MQKIQLSWHKKICEACKTYETQSNVLNKELQNHFTKQDEDVVAIEVLKNKIKASLGNK